jgi:hypothetical protein
MAAVAAALGLWMTEAHAAGQPLPNKLEREMRVMSRTIDDALVDSPNLLVPNTEPTGGVYVDGVGAMFSFKATLVREHYDTWSWAGDHHVEVHRNGKVMIFDGDDDDEWEDEDGKDAEERKSERSTARKTRAKRLDRRYDRGKEELVDVLLDAGDILSSLKDSEQVIIAASFGESDYLDDKGINQLILKARVSDLRAYANGTIKRDAAAAKVELVEN